MSAQVLLATQAPRFYWLRRSVEALLPAPLTVSRRERLRVVLGAALGLALAATLSHWFADPALSLPWLIAPLGATTVLVFAAPASPMAQP